MQRFNHNISPAVPIAGWLLLLLLLPPSPVRHLGSRRTLPSILSRIRTPGLILHLLPINHKLTACMWVATEAVVAVLVSRGPLHSLHFSPPPNSHVSPALAESGGELQRRRRMDTKWFHIDTLAMSPGRNKYPGEPEPHEQKTMEVRTT